MSRAAHSAFRAALAAFGAASGRTIVFFDQTASTMDEARALAAAGEAGGALVVAERQTAGRGRLGRSFVSPRGGLYMTLIAEPPGDPAFGWRVGFAAALAARDAIAACGGPTVDFDWPNDLVHGGRKVGGILLELLTPPRVESPLLLVGIGLNVGPDPRATDPDAAGPAGPVGFCDAAGDPRAAVAIRLIEAFEPLAALCGTDDGFGSVLESIRGASLATRGNWITVRENDGTLVEGRGEGIEFDGSLRLRQRDGRVLRVRYAERVYAPAPDDRN